MGIQKIQKQPKEFSHFPKAHYCFYTLHNQSAVYGTAALAEHPDFFEVHLELTRWSPKICRCLQEDSKWLRYYAQKKGKQRIVAIRQETGAIDPRWPKFTRLMGFSKHAIVQTALLEVQE